MRRPVETIYDPRLSDAPPSVEVTMLVRHNGLVVAQSRAVDDTGRLRLPPGWLELDRGRRDEGVGLVVVGGGDGVVGGLLGAVSGGGAEAGGS